MPEELKAYSQSSAQANISPVADFIAPVVPVSAPTGLYKVYSDKNFFRLPDTRRASGGRATQLTFDNSDATFNCTPHAIDVPVDIIDGGDADVNEAFMEAADLASEVGGLSHEKSVLDLAVSSATAKTPSFADSADPIPFLDEYIEGLIKAAGYGALMNVRIVIGGEFLRRIKNHPKVTAKIVANGKRNLYTVNEEMLTSLLIGNPEIRTSWMIYDTAAEGKDASRSFILGASMLIFMAKDNPTRRDPSFMKTFRLRSKYMQPGSYERDDGRVQVAKFDWSEHVSVTNSAAGIIVTPTWS